ncbi:hypothetical protein [Rhizobium sp. NXC14]|uniref:hypothetical protein n=1 Tax=Rhizobium sp. NXC14 TaxID=1981173 RepID=UPI000A268CA9|nr:hypothetical protein [Rhizobium sp. NXC14]
MGEIHHRLPLASCPSIAFVGIGFGTQGSDAAVAAPSANSIIDDMLFLVAMGSFSLFTAVNFLHVSGLTICE